MAELYHRRGRCKMGGGGSSNICDVLPPVPEDGGMPGDRLSGSSA